MKSLTGAFLAMLAGLSARDAQAPVDAFPLQGTWTLVAADKVLPDGRTTRDYGDHPKGRLVVDAKGRYSLQIFKSERARFASDNKADGDVDEFRSAVMGSSTHYGTVAINHWPAVAYALMTMPWGGYGGGTLAEPGSGVGWVHNAFLLEGVEKSVLEGPLTLWPKPFWFPSHRRAWTLARRVTELYRRPRWWKIVGLAPPALLG